MKNRILIHGVIIILLTIFACEDPASTVDPQENYLPLAIGNYWVFNTYKLDAYNNRQWDSLSRDSIIVMDKMDILGTEAYFLEVYRNSSIHDSLYVQKSGNRILMLFDEEQIGLPGFSTQWLQIADFSLLNGYSHVYDSVFNTQFDFVGDYYNAFSNHAMNLYISNKSDSLEVHGVKSFAKGFEFRYDRKYSFDYPHNNNLDTSLIEVTRLKKDHYFFIEGVGFSAFDFLSTKDLYKATPKVNGFPVINSVYYGTYSKLIDWHLE